jgi:molybdenum cofactor cytidylyltransferase
MENMWDELGLRQGACVAFIGAGGKTTSILALAGEAVERGLSVVVTTTTRMWPPTSMPLVLDDEREDIVATALYQLSASPCIAVGKAVTAAGKLAGLEPSAVCRLAESGVADVVLCEADGAAGRPLKLHGAHEPVVPGCATTVAVLAGLDSLGRIPGPEVIHRFERYVEMALWPAQEPISPATCADLMVLAGERLPSGVPAVYILTKADEPGLRHAAGAVAAEIAARVASPRVVVTSHLSSMEPREDHAVGDSRGRKAHAAT